MYLEDSRSCLSCAEILAIAEPYFMLEESTKRTQSVGLQKSVYIWIDYNQGAGIAIVVLLSQLTF